MANGKPNAGLMDVPSQLDPAYLAAELELVLPNSSNVVIADIEAKDVGSVEIIPEDDGGVVVDFDPQDQRGTSDDFYANLAEEIPKDELNSIANQLLADFNANKSSRQEWEDAYTNGLELLGFTYDERTQPFLGASGVTHPLLAEAATQFQAQAFNELLPASGPVRTVVMGKETPSKTQQASRVRQYMNYYITNRMEEYTPDMDQMLFYLPLAGSTFKKTYFDETLGRAVSKFVPAENLVVPYETADLETCSNITHVVRMPLNDLRKRQIVGTYLDIEVLPSQKETSELSAEMDRIEGLEPNQIDNDCTILECHVDLDLEGYEDLDEDGEPTGIKLPYVVTISENNSQVLSVRRNYREDDKLCKKIPYFTHFKFLPGFGFYGLGLIHAIGGLSRTATSTLRQLIDAGTLSNLPAGFKTRGMKISDENSPLQPGEFRPMDIAGGSIRDSIMPLPFKGPDQTLFNLLGFVVEAGQRFATITDLKVGDGNQQAAVGTTIAMMEQGTRVMSAVHKRLHYAMKQEFKILARLISESLPSEKAYPYTVPGGDENIMQDDFDDRVDIVPVSNPNVFSQAQRIVMAQTKLQLATQAPELHNLAEVFRDMYEALGVTDVDRIMKSVPEEKPKPIDPAQENINVLDMVELHAFEGQDHQAHITAHLVFGASPMVGGMPPVAVALQKHIMEHVQIAAKEQAAVVYLQKGRVASDDEMLEMERLTAQFVAEGLQQVKELSGQLSGAGAPDPLIQLKEQELQLKAQNNQADQAIDQAKIQLEKQKLQTRVSQFDQNLASKEKQTNDRIAAGLQRELLRKQGD